MSEPVYVQSIGVRLRLPGGKEVMGKFTGLSFCSPDVWNQIKNADEGIESFLSEKNCLVFSDPIPLEKAVAGKDYNDIVDVIREEVRKEHHNDLID